MVNLNLSLALTSELDLNSNHNHILPVHLTEDLSLTITMARAPGIEPSSSPSMSPIPHHNMKLNIALDITSESDPNSDHTLYNLVNLTKHLTLTLALAP